MNALLTPAAAPPDAAYDADGDDLTPIPNRPLTEAEYLRIERAAGGRRCEFDGTYRLPMPNNSRRYVDIARAVEEAFRTLIAAAGRPLTTYRSDLRMHIPSGRYRYPDVMLTPAPPAMLDGEQDTVVNPLIVVEVLSPSTAHIDRGAKLAEYRSVPSLTDYLLISQDEPAADHYVRVGGGADHPDEPDAWRLISYEGPAAAVPLAGLGDLTLGPLYPQR